MKRSFDPQILINLRRSHYWTQEELALASGVSTRTIQRLERSDGGGSLETWKALAAAFEIDVQSLEVEPAPKCWSGRKTMFGYMTIGYAATLSVCGSFAPWIPIISNLNHGARLEQLWPFFMLAIGIPIYCTVILTWSWRHLNRMAPL